MNEQRKIIYQRRQQILDGEDLRRRRPSRRSRTRRAPGRRSTAAASSPRTGTSTSSTNNLTHALCPTDVTRGPARRLPATSTSSTSCCSARRSRMYEEKEESIGEGDAARHRTARDALGDRPALARAPLRDGLPAGGHQPAGHGPAGPAVGVAARGLRHVRGDDGPDRRRLRPLRVPPAGRRRRAAPQLAIQQPAVQRRPRTRSRARRPAMRGRPPADQPPDDRRWRRRPTAEAFDAVDPERGRSSRCGSRRPPGRNEPCFCGSGKKYKLCHGR